VQGNPQLSGNNSPENRRLSVEQVNELLQLYEQAPCGYHSLDDRGVYIRINQTELAMLGYDREEMIGKKKFSDLLTPKSQQVFREIGSQFKQQSWVRDLELQMLRKDGSAIPVSLSATAVWDAAGK
jgi:PAS domain S-box-containing protein